jgi:MFS family permease
MIDGVSAAPARPWKTGSVIRVPQSLDPLRERPFRLLFLGRSLSGIGDAIVPVALTFAVLDIGDATDLGIVFGTFFAARAAFVIPGGVWADRLPRQLVMIAADVLRGCVEALLAVAFFTDTIAIWQLAIGSGLVGVGAAFFNPASTGLIPKLVSPGQLQEANALLSVSRGAINIFGPAVSGALVSTVGFGIVFAIDAATFAASFLCLAAMRLPRAVQRVAASSMLADAREGLRELRRQRWIVITLCCDMVTNIGIGAYLVLGPVVVERHFDGARDWGLMMTAAALGGLAGGAFALRVKASRPLLAGYAVILALPLQLFALAPPAPLALLIVGAALVIFSIEVGNTYWTTTEQQYVPPEAISRVDAISWFVSLVGMPFGMVLVGPLADAIGVTTTLVGAGVLSVTALSAALSTRTIRDLRRLDTVEAPTEAASPAVSSLRAR